MDSAQPMKIPVVNSSRLLAHDGNLYHDSTQYYSIIGAL